MARSIGWRPLRYGTNAVVTGAPTLDSRMKSGRSSELRCMLPCFWTRRLSRVFHVARRVVLPIEQAPENSRLSEEASAICSSLAFSGRIL